MTCSLPVSGIRESALISLQFRKEGKVVTTWQLGVPGKQAGLARSELPLKYNIYSRFTRILEMARFKQKQIIMTCGRRITKLALGYFEQ